MREAHFGADFSFSEEKVLARRNGDLGNDFGNLVKRSLAMLARYRSGRVPQPGDAPSPFAARFSELGSRVGGLIDALAFREALDAIWELVTALNVHVEQTKPWDLYKRRDDASAAAELDTVLYDLCEGLRWLAHLTFPFMPVASRSIWSQLGLDGEPHGAWAHELVWGGLAPETATAPSEGALFPRLELQTAEPA
jgi:methionyl-tRNA synthetase